MSLNLSDHLAQNCISVSRQSSSFTLEEKKKTYHRFSRRFASKSERFSSLFPSKRVVGSTSKGSAGNFNKDRGTSAEASSIDSEESAPSDEVEYCKTMYVEELVTPRKSFHSDLGLIKFPEVQLAPWGTKWSHDLVVFLHNAVLGELKDIFSFAKVLQQRRFAVRRSHIEVFYKHFDVSQAFIEACLSVEEEYLIPWITAEGKNILDGSVGDSKRMLFVGTIRRVLMLISEFRCRFDPRLPVGEKLPNLFALIEKLKIIPQYQIAAQSILPSFIEQHHLHTPLKRASVLRGIFYSMSCHPNYQANSVLLTRWLSRTSSKSIVNSLLWRPLSSFQFGNRKESVLQDHCSIISTFDVSIVSDEATAISVDQKEGCGIALAIRHRFVRAPMQHSVY